MRRRAFIAAICGAAAVSRPLMAQAQQKTTPAIGILGVAPGDLGLVVGLLTAFRRGLADTGYVEGRNLAVEYRWANNHNDRLPGLAADLVARRVDVIANEGGDPSALAARNATSTIPLVVHCSDELMSTLVGSYARPGGNLTGVTTYAGDPLPKAFELVLELVPKSAIALLVNPNSEAAATQIRSVEQAAKTTGIPLLVFKAGNEGDIDAAFASVAQQKATALVVPQDVFFSRQRQQLVELASRYAVPTIYFARWFADAGGLVSYGAPFAEMYRLKGVYAGRILNGEKPGDLPIIRPTKFELVINLKTAQALGLTVPQALLARADEVIE